MTSHVLDHHASNEFLIGQEFFSLLKVFVFEIITVLPDGHHIGSEFGCSLTFSNANLNALLAGFSFFHQKF